eukprot:2325930-Rhodomonas_salina.1
MRAPPFPPPRRSASLPRCLSIPPSPCRMWAEGRGSPRALSVTRSLRRGTHEGRRLLWTQSKVCVVKVVWSPERKGALERGNWERTMAPWKRRPSS